MIAQIGAGGINISAEFFAMSLAAFLVVSMVSRIEKSMRELTKAVDRQGRALVGLVATMADDRPELRDQVTALMNGYTDRGGHAA